MRQIIVAKSIVCRGALGYFFIIFFKGGGCCLFCFWFLVFGVFFNLYIFFQKKDCMVYFRYLCGVCTLCDICTLSLFHLNEIIYKNLKIQKFILSNDHAKRKSVNICNSLIVWFFIQGRRGVMGILKQSMEICENADIVSIN